MNKTKAIVVGGFFILLLIALVSYLFVLAPRSASVGEIQEQTESVQSQNVTLQGQVTQLNAALTNSEALVTEAKAIQQQFPGTAELPLLFAAVNKAAKDAGIPESNVETLTPTSPVVGAAGASGGSAAAAGTAPTATMSVNIVASSSYENLIKFQKNLQSFNRIFLVDTSTITTDTEGTAFMLNVTGRMVLIDQANMNLYIAQVEALAANQPVPTELPVDPALVPASPAPAASDAASPAASGAASPAASPAPAASDAASPVASPAPAASDAASPVASPAPAAS